MAARIATLVLAALAGVVPVSAGAQEVTLTVSLPDRMVGIDACASTINRTFNASGTYAGAPLSASYQLWLTINTANDTCNQSLASCVNEAGSSCKCMALVNGIATVSADSQRVSTYYPAETLCAYDTETTLYFFAEYYQPSEGFTNEFSRNSEAFTVLFDNRRPAFGAEPPTLSGANNALMVTFPGVTGANRYEVCARPILESPLPEPDRANEPPAVEGVSNEDLRGEYQGARCQTFSSSPARLEGLRNGVTYYVVYAAIDEAGNRGSNSPSAVGTPVEVKSLAEYYSEICRGPEPEEGREAWAARPCEDGGCRSQGAAPGPAGLLALFALAGLIVRRRRNP